MAISLTGQSPAATYNTLVVTDGTFIYDGVGVKLTSVNVTSSWATSASYALNGGGTSTYTSSLYGTASWSNNSINSIQSVYTTQSLFSTQSLFATSASWASRSLSSSYVTASNVVGNITSASYALSSSWTYMAVTSSYSNYYNVTIYNESSSFASSSISSSYASTSSWALNSQTASSINFIPLISISASWVSASVRITTADTASYISSTNLPAHTASWATNAVSSISSTSSSYASASTSASYAPVEPSYSASISSVKQNTLTNTLYVLTASLATTASFALNGGGSGTTLTTGSTYPITASWANNSLTASNINFIPLTTTSASWASSSISASYSPVQPAYSASVSSVKQNTLITSNTYSITSSWANNAITSSYFTSSQVQIIDGQLKLYNITTGNYYVIVVSGSVGEETLQIGV